MRYVCNFGFESIEHFQDYFFGVYGSNHPTVAEKIIFFAGLYAILAECACVT